VGSTARLSIDEFAPRLSFFFTRTTISSRRSPKYRAARKIWAMLMRDRFGAKAERSLKLRFRTRRPGARSPGSSRRHIVRTTLQAMAAVLGGAQSLHTNSLDEAYALPSEHAVTIAFARSR